MNLQEDDRAAGMGGDPVAVRQGEQAGLSASSPTASQAAKAAGSLSTTLADEETQSHAPAKGARSASKDHRITRPALAHLDDLRRENFIRFGNMRIANHVAVGEAMERLTVRDGVVDLKPQSPTDRRVAERLRRKGMPARESEVAAAEPDDIARRRRDWDEAKRTGDPDAMTRTANALIHAVDKARAHLDNQEDAHAAPSASGRHRTSEILYLRDGPADKQASASGVSDRESVDEMPTGGLTQSGAETLPDEDDVEAPTDTTISGDSGLPFSERAQVPSKSISKSDRAMLLTSEEAKAIAQAIFRAPENERGEVLQDLREQLGETATAYALRQYPRMWAVDEHEEDSPQRGGKELQSADSHMYAKPSNRGDGMGSRSALAASKFEIRDRSELREDLPDKIDYARKGRNTRPVLVIGMLGAGGGGNDHLARLVRDLGGRPRYTEQDAVADDTLREINAFQREHPDGIVVVIGYSHGGFDFAHKIAGRTNRPIDVAVLFDPYNADRDDIELPRGSVRFGFNFYQRNETDAPWYWPFGGDNPFRGSRVRNPEFTNYDLTGRSAADAPNTKIGHNSIVGFVMDDATLSAQLNRALRR